MLQSRFSIPLIALFILAIAGCMLYLLNVQNIFQAHFPNLFDHVATTENSQNISTSTHELSLQKTTIENELEDTLDNENSGLIARRKPRENGLDGADEPADNGNSARNESAVRQTQNANVKNAYFDVGAYQLAEDNTRSAEIRSLWLVYSQHVPSLYSAPLNRDTQEKLARIAQVSAELDQLYVSDKSEWLNRFTQVRSDLIEQAVKGEREGARTLSFQYAQQTTDETINALMWAMIANSIAENNYYLYICSGDKAWLCSERAFSKASEQALTIIHDYGFLLRK